MKVPADNQEFRTTVATGTDDARAAEHYDLKRFGSRKWPTWWAMYQDKKSGRWHRVLELGSFPRGYRAGAALAKYVAEYGGIVNHYGSGFICDPLSIMAREEFELGVRPWQIAQWERPE